MDEHKIDINAAQTTEDEEGSVASPKVARNLVLLVLMGVVFVAVTIMVHMIAKQSLSLLTEAQKLLFPLGSAFLIAGLTVVWLYHQTLKNDRLHHEAPPWFFPVTAGAVTLLIAVLAYICIGMWPVGELSPMIVDLHHQYAPMLSQLRDMLLNGGSPLYSFDIGTGTSFIPLFAYYLASPLNLLLIVFPQAYLAEGVLIITLVKMALTGAFMALCVQYIFKRRNYSSVAIAVMYAFMMYMLAYSWDIMWLDCVMFLPLVIMGFERMMRTGKYLMYVLTLAYTLYANYYIGFMICIFLVLYYLAFFFRAKRTPMQQGVGFARFAIGSLLGGGLAMFILLPAFLSLSSTSAAGGDLPDFATNFNVFELIGRGLYGVEPTVRSGNLPNIYCGVLAVLTLPIFATMSGIPLRRRLSYLALFGIMAVSLVINQLDLLWHGLHSPNDLPYRFSFLYSFALLLIAYEVLYRIKDIKPLQIGSSIFGIAVYLIIEEQFGTENYSYSSLYLSFGLILVYGIIMLLVSQKKLAARSAYVLLAVFVVAETLFNAAATLQKLNNNEHYTKHKDYLDNTITQTVQTTVDRMEEIGDAAANGDFYRIEIAPRRTTADTAMFDYRGITNFASTGSYNMTRFMGSMGFDVNGVNSQLYRHFVPTSDSLMGLKYLAFDSEYTNQPYLQKLEEIQSGDGKYTYYIYENPYALPVGFMVNSAIKDWNYNYYDPMSSQNSLYKTMTGTEENVMICEQITTLTPNSATVDGTSNFNIKNGSTSIFTATVSKTGHTYVHVDCRAAKSINVNVVGGGSWGVTTYQPYIIDVGYLEAGTEVKVTINTNGGCTGAVYVAQLDDAVFTRDIEMLSANGLTVTSFNDSSLEGSVIAAESGVMCMAIEYDAGWTVMVDGNEVETFAIGEALIGFEVGAGEHTIAMTFMPRGLVPGIVISVTSLFVLVFLLDYVKRRDTGKGFIPFLNKKEQQGADK